ncbi:MAG: NAD-dependent epimerase/dehydratase family protein [Actinomycetota bacterium]
MKVLVTGATGFVGGAVLRALATNGHEAVAAVRRADHALPAAVCPVRVGELGPHTDWTEALAGAEAVVHLAARAHVLNDPDPDPLAVFRRVNRDGTVRLAEQAVAAGVKRLVFVSTIKVHGEATPPGRPFRPEDPPAPEDGYGLAKAEAEAALADIAARTGMELVVIRPPLVHGPRAKGNLASLMTAIARRMPLPLGAIDNRRSLVGVDNLADLVRVCLEHPAAAGRSFLVRDSEDVSTPGLIRRLAGAMGRRPLLVPVPPALLTAAGRLLGRQTTVERLLGSLTVDDAATREVLGWQPRIGLDEGLSAMAAAWRARAGA